MTYSRTYNYSTGSYEYSNVAVTESSATVRYVYNADEEIWKADSASLSAVSSYNLISTLTEQGLINEKYLNALILTYDEVLALRIDRNTNINPNRYYIYNGTAEPGTEVFMGDINNDGLFNVSDAVLLQKWLLAVPNTQLANWKNGDFNSDGSLDVFDLCLMKRALIQQQN